MESAFAPKVLLHLFSSPWSIACALLTLSRFSHAAAAAASPARLFLLHLVFLAGLKCLATSASVFFLSLSLPSSLLKNEWCSVKGTNMRQVDWDISDICCTHLRSIASLAFPVAVVLCYSGNRSSAQNNRPREKSARSQNAYCMPHWSLSLTREHVKERPADWLTREEREREREKEKEKEKERYKHRQTFLLLITSWSPKWILAYLSW